MNKCLCGKHMKNSVPFKVKDVKKKQGISVNRQPDGSSARKGLKRERTY